MEQTDDWILIASQPQRWHVLCPRLLVVLLSLFGWWAGNGSVVLAAPPSFKTQIAPMLWDRCVECHGPRKAGGGWRADTFARAAQPGESTLSVWGKSLEESELWRRVTSEDASERMPLEDDPLSAEELATLKSWLEGGMPFDGPDPQTPLLDYLPVKKHPPAPARYRTSLPITALAGTADGRQLYVSGYREVTLWDIPAGKLVKRIDNLPPRIFAIVPSPDHSLLAVAGGEPGRWGEVRLIQTDSARLDKVLGVTNDVVLATAFSPSGKEIATGAADGKVRLFDVETGTLRWISGSHSDWIFALAWSPDGQRIVSASRDGTAKVTSANDGKLEGSFAMHNVPVAGLFLTADGKRVISTGVDKRLFRWTLQERKKEKDLSLSSPISAVVRAGDPFAVGTQDGEVSLYSVDKFEQQQKLASVGSAITSLSYLKPSGLIAIGTFAGEIVLWNPQTDEPAKRFVALPGLENHPTDEPAADTVQKLESESKPESQPKPAPESALNQTNK